MRRGDFVRIAMQGDFGKSRPAFGRIDAGAMIEVERCLAVFLEIAK